MPFQGKKELCDKRLGPAKRAVAFDTAFNHNDPSKFYCTELVTELYRQAGHPVVSDSVLQKRAIFPGHLANSDRLKQIGTTRGVVH